MEAITRFPTDGALIVEGHYLVENEGEPVTVHCSNPADGRVGVQYMCGGGTLYATRKDVERMLCGRVVPDPVKQAEVSRLLDKLHASVVARQTSPARKRSASA